jgi:myo-inositol-1(or 4)-monophosphatase
MNARDLDLRLAAAADIVRAAGRLALDYFHRRGTLEIERKGRQDLVSVADRAVEDLIRRELDRRFPEDGILGEEGGLKGDGGTARRLWVLDPIDGTFNFLRGIPCWGVICAYVVGGRTMLGLTYDPVHDELFTARRGGGAFRNGTPIRVSGKETVDTACLALTYSFRQPERSYVDLVAAALARGFEHRRMGSTAVQLGYVADGRCDGLATLYCSSWDVLAGLLLVEEAGGIATDFIAAHGLLGKGGVLAGTPALADELAAVSGLPRPLRSGDR